MTISLPRKILRLALFSALVFPAPAGWAQKPPSVEISHKKKDLERVQAELEKKKKEQEALEKEASELARRLKEEQVRVQEIEKSLMFTLQKNVEVQNDLAKTKNQFDNENILYGEKKDRLKAGVQSLYLASALTGAGSPYHAYGAHLVANQRKSLNDIDTRRKETRNMLGQLMETSQVYQTEVFKQKGEIGTIKTAMTEGQTKLKKNLTKREVIEKDLKDLERTSRELAGLIDLLRQKAETEKKAEEEQRKKNIQAGRSPIATNSLIWPVKGKVIQSFGRQKHPDFGTPFISNGVKIQAQGRHAVRVVSPGTVLYVGSFMSYGPMVVVEHKDDWFSVYGNMSSWAVEKGQPVREGDTAGWTDVAEDGSSQVYFELRFYGKPTNPIPWLSKN